MNVAFLAALLLAYNGMTLLCLGMERHYKQVWRVALTRGRQRWLRGCGWAALALSLLACGEAWNWAMGPVGWGGMLSVGGFGLLMLLPYYPRTAVWGGVLAWPVVAAAALLSA